MRFELTTHRVLVPDPLWTGTSVGITVEIYMRPLRHSKSHHHGGVKMPGLGRTAIHRPK